MAHKQAPQHDFQQIQDVFFSHGSFSSVFFQNFKIVNVISLSGGSYLKKKTKKKHYSLRDRTTLALTTGLVFGGRN